MIDIENTISNLETNIRWIESTECHQFPGWGNVTMAMRDALELLKEQEPRVMTLDEITEIYVEFNGDDCPVRLTNFDLQKIVMYMVDGSCRLWTGKPTDEQREAVKWE